MSCNCKNTQTAGEKFVCTCDQFEHPPKLNIGAGLTDLPRQMAGFPEFRRAMLSVIHNDYPLSMWRARKDDDLGIMLIEMWAYICDNLSFYDKMIAQESYLRTARLRPSLRKLVALLGYLPSPAVASTVKLAVLGDGRLPIRLPKGTSFRSGAFDDNPPQVFELDKETWIHPLTNKWAIRPPHIGTITDANPDFLLIQPQANIKPEAFIFLLDKGNAGQNRVLRVKSVNPYTGNDKRVYTKVTFDSNHELTIGTPLNRLQLMLPTQSATLWTINETSLTTTTVVLDNLYKQISSNDFILITKNKTEPRWYQVNAVKEVVRYPNTEADSQIVINKSTFSIPRTPIRVTELTLDTAINNRKIVTNIDWSDSDKTTLQVNYGLIPAGIVVDEPKLTLASNDPLAFDGKFETPIDRLNAKSLMLQDKNLRSVALEKSSIGFANGELILDNTEGWQPEMTLPVDIFGNIIATSRGETVNSEILGSGNASLSNQTFKLKKKPLTYLLSSTATNDQGTVNTLKIHVNGIEWQEVATFYGKKPYDTVYIVRQNDDEDTFVTFGDGIRGQRLPSDTDNVVASYRFGGGRASPPANSITQIGKPVKGLQSVKNPVAAAGGADRESAEGVRKYAPKSALLLGRAVSIQDMAVVVLSFPGVRAAQVEWNWHPVKQRAVVHVWYIGEEGIETKIAGRLRSVTDPTVPIKIERAKPVPVNLSIDITVDPRYEKEVVLAKVHETLIDAENGLLLPENVGIGKPFFRSQLFEAVLAVEGTTAIHNVVWNTAVFSEFAKTLDKGSYFNFEEINGALVTDLTQIPTPSV